MLLADTGYFIAIVNPIDQLHKRAVAWTIRLDEQILVTEYVLVEAMNALSRLSMRSRGCQLSSRIETDPLFVFEPVTQSLLDGGLTLFRTRVDKEWSLTDCVSFAVMQERGIERSLTHDHHFTQAGFDALLRRNP